MILNDLLLSPVTSYSWCITACLPAGLLAYSIYIRLPAFAVTGPDPWIYTAACDRQRS